MAGGWSANATAAVLEDARQLATLLRGEGIRRSPASIRGPSRDVFGPPAASGRSSPSRVRSTRRPRSSGHAASRAGRTRTSSRKSPAAIARSASRARAARWSRSSTTGSRPTSSTRSGGAGRGCGCCRTRPRWRPSWPMTSRASCSRRDRATRHGSTGRSRSRAVIDDGRPLLGMRAPDRRTGRGRRDAAAAVRASRGQPPGPGPRHRHGPGDRAEPRGPGGRGLAAGCLGVPGQPAEPQRPLGRGAASSDQADRDGPVPPGGRRARSMRWRCSTDSWTSAARERRGCSVVSCQMSAWRALGSDSGGFRCPRCVDRPSAADRESIWAVRDSRLRRVLV